MLVHSSTMAPMSGWRATRPLPASTTSWRARSTSRSCFSPLISTRKNSWPFSVPAIGASSGTPAPSRWAGVRLWALTLTMPTRLPGGRVACTHGTCISDDVAPGTEIAQGGPRGNEVLQQAGGAVQHHALGAGAAHHTEQHRERPGRAVAH